jgi:hypothetical protein
MWRRQELKLAASGWMYFPPSARRCEWNTNLFGEKKIEQKVHLMHFALEELYRAGMNWPLQPQAQSCMISNAKLSGSLGGELSPRKLLQSRSASLEVIIPHLLGLHDHNLCKAKKIHLEDIGMAPARLRISSWTGVHCTQVMPRATLLL